MQLVQEEISKYPEIPVTEWIAVALRCFLNALKFLITLLLSE